MLSLLLYANEKTHTLEVVHGKYHAAEK